MDVHAPHLHGRFLRGTTLKARFRAHRRQTMVCAHRGHWGPLPENSFAAIRAATRCDIVEVDVRLDATDTPYLFHDETLDRMTQVSGAADGVDPGFLSELRLCEGAGGASAPLTEELVPTLEASFEALAGTGAIFALNVMRQDEIEAVGDAVAHIGCQELAILQLDVRNADDIARLVALEERSNIMTSARIVLRTRDDLALVVSLREADVAAVEVQFEDLNLLRRTTAFTGDLMRFGTATLDASHCMGLSDSLALRDPSAVWGRLLDAGVRLIKTDQPEALARYILTR